MIARETRYLWVKLHCSAEMDALHILNNLKKKEQLDMQDLKRFASFNQ